MIHSSQRNNHKIAEKLRQTIYNELYLVKFSYENFTQYKNFLNLNQPIIVKIFWLLAITSCFCISLSQILNRIKYYFTYPTRVDIKFELLNSVNYTELKFCTFDNEYILQMKKNYLTENDCIFGPINKILDLDDINYDLLWQHDKNFSLLHQFNLLNQENFDYNFLKVSEDKSIKGQCLKYQPKREYFRNKKNEPFTFKFGKRRLCTPTPYALEVAYDSGFNLVARITVGYTLNILFNLRHFYFVNTPVRKCLDYKTFQNCITQCKLDETLDNVKCRLPFHDKMIKLPKCDNKSDAKNSFYNTSEITRRPRIHQYCKCSRTCNERKFISAVTYQENNVNLSIVQFKVDFNVISLIETLSYPISHLLIDVSGNLGLFLGLSLLSFLNICHFFFFMCNKKINSLSSPRKVFINKKCELYYMIHSSTEIKINSKNQFNFIKSINFHSIVKISIILSCIMFSCFIISGRIALYLLFSVRQIVKTELQATIHYPPMTVCSLNPKIASFKRIFAKKNNITNWCQVDLLDLFQTKEKYTFNFLWKSSYLKKKFKQSKHFLNKFGYKMLKTFQTSIDTHLGTCELYLFDKQNYFGMTTVLPFIFFGSAVNCGETSLQVFFDDIDSDSYNLLTAMYIPIPYTSILDYRLQTISRINNKIKPCVDNKMYKTCKNNCMENFMEASKLCRLPNFKNATNLKPCNTSAAAKTSLNKFLKIFSAVFNNKICKCTRSCHENVIFINLSTMNVVAPVFGFALTAFNTLVEHVIEVDNYSIVSLFCDIGNILGLSLGISILNIIGVLHTVLKLLKFKI